MGIRPSRVIPFEKLSSADLHVDAVYEAGTAKNLGAEPIVKMLPVGNAGGFRANGKAPNPNLVVLFTSGEEGEWPDHIDPFTGIVRYFGDNRTPGKELHETSKKVMTSFALLLKDVIWKQMTEFRRQSFYSLSAETKGLTPCSRGFLFQEPTT